MLSSTYVVSEDRDVMKPQYSSPLEYTERFTGHNYQSIPKLIMPHTSPKLGLDSSIRCSLPPVASLINETQRGTITTAERLTLFKPKSIESTLPASFDTPEGRRFLPMRGHPPFAQSFESFDCCSLAVPALNKEQHRPIVSAATEWVPALDLKLQSGVAVTGFQHTAKVSNTLDNGNYRLDCNEQRLADCTLARSTDMHPRTFSATPPSYTPPTSISNRLSPISTHHTQQSSCDMAANNSRLGSTSPIYMAPQEYVSNKHGRKFNYNETCPLVFNSIEMSTNSAHTVDTLDLNRAVATKAAQHISYTPMDQPVRPNVNTKARDHICPECGRAFQRAEHVRRHQRTHTNERPFVCPVLQCGRAFGRSDNLNAHLRSHEKKQSKYNYYRGIGQRRSLRGLVYLHVNVNKPNGLESSPSVFTVNNAANADRTDAPINGPFEHQYPVARNGVYTFSHTQSRAMFHHASISSVSPKSSARSLSSTPSLSPSFEMSCLR